jgi:flagellar biosynthetic protein FlhB
MVLGALGSRILIAWRESVCRVSRSGLAAHWEPATMAPTLLRCAGWRWAFSGPAAVMMAAVAAAALGIGVLQTGGSQLLSPPSASSRTASIPFLEHQEPVLAARRRAAGQVADSGGGAGRLCGAAHRQAADAAAVFDGAPGDAGRDVYGLLLAAAWLLFGWSAIDYLVEWQSRESRLKMSREDMRDEMKQTEGNPQIKRPHPQSAAPDAPQAGEGRCLEGGRGSDQSHHYAVALGFDFATMEAPKVLAKGRNLLAEEIKAEARWAGVPIIENPPLARSLYRTVESARRFRSTSTPP